ncbi:hypothetical protein BJX99DRAFT_57313 [Aspergillus californicus]
MGDLSLTIRVKSTEIGLRPSIDFYTNCAADSRRTASGSFSYHCGRQSLGHPVQPHICHTQETVESSSSSKCNAIALCEYAEPITRQSESRVLSLNSAGRTSSLLASDFAFSHHVRCPVTLSDEISISKSRIALLFAGEANPGHTARSAPTSLGPDP